MYQVPEGTFPLPQSREGTAPARGLDARGRRAERGRQQRRWQQRASFSDSAAFAYLRGWPLEKRVTVGWEACTYGDRRPGHILGRSDKQRTALLCGALRQHLRKHEEPFACIWARDTGGRHGQHIHLALYWPLPLEELAWVLAGLTGSLPSSGRLSRSVVAQSECGGWQVKRNTAREEIPSAARWTVYLLEQEPRHLVMPALEGKVLGVSRAIDARAIALHREALEAWKVRRGWTVEDKPSGALQQPAGGQP